MNLILGNGATITTVGGGGGGLRAGVGGKQICKRNTVWERGNTAILEGDKVTTTPFPRKPPGRPSGLRKVSSNSFA